MPKRTRLQLIHPFLWLYTMANRRKASQEEIHVARLSGHQEEPCCDPGCWEQRGCSRPRTLSAAQSLPPGTAPGQACKPAASSRGSTGHPQCPNSRPLVTLATKFPLPIHSPSPSCSAWDRQVFIALCRGQILPPSFTRLPHAASPRHSGRLFHQSQAVGRVLMHLGPKDHDFG